MIVSHNYLIICCIVNEALHFFQSVSSISSDHISEYVDLRTINNAVSLIQYFTCFFLNLFFKHFKMTLNTLSVFLISFCNYFVHFSLHWIKNPCLFLLRLLQIDVLSLYWLRECVCFLCIIVLLLIAFYLLVLHYWLFNCIILGENLFEWLHKKILFFWFFFWFSFNFWFWFKFLLSFLFNF
jgi:hypothetical protein